MIVKHKIKIRLDGPRGPMPDIDVMQGDAYTRELEFSLYSGGEAWNVPEGVSVAVAYRGASGHGQYTTLPNGTAAYTVSGNVVTVTLIPQVAAVKGETIVSAIFTDAAGKQLATFAVTVRVALNPAIGAGNPEDYYNIREWIGAGPTRINVASNGDGVYTADANYTDILQQHDHGSVIICCLETADQAQLTLPFVKLEDGVFYFSTVCDGVEWLVTIGPHPEDDSAVVSVTSRKGAAVSPEAGISLTSSAEKVTLLLRGTGKARLFAGNSHQVAELTEDGCEVTVKNSDGTIYIDGVAGITELDVHGQAVTSFTANVECGLRKLVIYDNDLTALDCSNFGRLQYLHIHNNPMCDDETYRDSLIACMRSLPNRSQISTGSIILYPWYGLEVLICMDAQGSYYKYPSGYSPLTLEEGRLYGVVDGDKITYYTYSGGTGQIHSAMNRHHTLRKALEKDVCLRKNWVFGSAIMYDEADWAKCPWDFRASHIADLWETAEKGFGLTYGGFDKYTNAQIGFKHFNVIDFRCPSWHKDSEGNYIDELVPAIDYTDASNAGKAGYNSFVKGEWDHGDNQLSMLFGNGEEEGGEVQRIGYIPNSCCYLVDRVSLDGTGTANAVFPVIAQAFTDNCDAVSLSFSMTEANASNVYIAEARRLLGLFGENNIFTHASGNTGDGKPYTAEAPGAYIALSGKYVVEVDGVEVEKPSTALMISGVMPNKVIGGYSNTNVDAIKVGRGRESYLSYFGDAICASHNYTRRREYVSGTSYASPLCCGMLMLMRIIYAKMFPQETSFGKYSSFMDHVRNRWCDHFDGQMDFAMGYGFPNLFAESRPRQLLGKAPEVDHLDTVILGDALDVTYGAEKYAKHGFTPEQKLSCFASTRDGKIYPLVANAELALLLYSNSSLKEPASLAENYFVNEIAVKVLPNTVDEVQGALPLVLTTLSNEYVDEEVVRVADPALDGKAFTVQLALDFTDKLYPKDAGAYTTTRDLIYFLNGAHVGRFILEKISYATGDAYVNLATSRFNHGYFDTACEQATDATIGWQIGSKLDMASTPYGIVTMTCSRQGVDYFFNGTHIGCIPNVPEIDIKVSDVFINSNSLCHDATGCVRIYDRVLTDEEIVRNTIFLLHSHFEEG